VGTKGDVWWACDGEVGPPIVVEYAPGASGNAAPVATLPLAAGDEPTFAVNSRRTLFVTQVFGGSWVLQVYPDIQSSSNPSATYTLDCGAACTIAAARGSLGIFRTEQGVSPSALIVYNVSGPSGPLRQKRQISGPNTSLDNPLGAAVR
jgi:hypothetical protein